MDIVDASPQSTNRSWTCSDVKTWPKNERQVSSTVYIILNPIPKALSDLSIATLPWENEMVWQTTTACTQVLRQVSTSSFPGSLLLVLWSLERGFLLLVTKGHYTAKQCFSFCNNLLFRLDSNTLRLKG